MTQGIEKLPGSLSLGGNFFKLIAERSLLRIIVANFINFPLFEMISF